MRRTRLAVATVWTFRTMCLKRREAFGVSEISRSAPFFSPQRGRRSTGVVALTVAFALVMGGCSQTPSLPATVKGPNYASVVTDVNCAPESRSVLVTATLTGVADVPAYSGLSATVYDSGKKQIGSADGPI